MLTILISIFLPVPIGIGVNLITPWFKTKISTYSQTRRVARIAKLQDEFLVIEAFRQGRDTNKLIMRTAKYIMLTLSYQVFTVMFFILYLTVVVQYGLRKSIWSAPLGQSSAGPAQAGTYACALFGMISLAVSAYYFFSGATLITRVISKSESFRIATKKALEKLGGSLSDAEISSET
jgi:hypothetical protein